MAQITITEALAELKLIRNKLAKKQETINIHLTRAGHVKDPFEKEGGSKKVLAGEQQSVRDLNERVIKIRRAIAKANDEAQVTIAGQVRSISEWLTWKREVMAVELKQLSEIRQRIDVARQQATRQSGALKPDDAQAVATDIIVNIDETELRKRIEQVQEIADNLDGQLSLKNATVQVQV